MRVWLCSFLLTLTVLGLCVSSARSQQQTQDQTAPIPAYRTPLASLAGSTDAADANADPQKLGPDTRSLAGAQDFSLGVPPLIHSYWQPHFDAMSTADSNPLAGTNQAGWTSYTSLLGGIDVRRTSGNSDLSLNYVGGASISNDGSIGNSTIQQFQLGEKLSWRRSAVSFFDEMGYIPEAGFGYGGLGGLSLPGGGTLGLQPVFVPSQSILTTRGQRITNSFLTQVDTFLTSRSSLTFVGSYSLQHYFDNNLLDLGNVVFQAGYNYQASRKDTIAVFYRFNGYRYSNFSQSIDDNSVQFSYGKRITGQLAFQAAAGPDVVLLQMPLNGVSNSQSGSGSSSSSTVHIYWSVNSALTYQMRHRADLGLSYIHGLTGGSGVLAGSVTDQASASISDQLARTSVGGFNFGYARNKGLGIGGAEPVSQSYDYWFSGAYLNHQWGRALNMFVSYQMQYQNSDASFCLGTSCGMSFIRHQVSIGFGWHQRPIAF